MKKVGKFLLVITALLCLFVLPGRSSIISKAANEVKAGTLNEGVEVNAAIKNLANNSSSMTYKDDDRNIKQIIFLKKNISPSQKAALEKQKKVSVGKDVWAYYSNGIVSFYSTADTISCNYKNSYLFYGITNITSMDLTMLDFTQVYDASGMFCKCTNIKEVNLSNIYAPKLHNVSGMFLNCSNLEQANFQGFKSDKIYGFEYMFSRCYKLKSVDLRSIGTKNIVETDHMFSECENLQYLDLSNFVTPALHGVGHMFENCTHLEYLDMSNFDFSKVIIYKEMFTGCVSLKTVIVPKGTNQVMNFPVLMVIDNDNDGKPDTSETFHKNPISDRSNRLIAFEGVYSAFAPKVGSASPEIIVNEKGVTYRINPDGTATVTKITASGKVSIDTVKYAGVTYPVKEIESDACKGNKKIKGLSIGENVISVGKNSFKSCKKLKKITIHANKELKIGKGAFKKLNKKAVIKVKGIKGKQKKALIRSIRKQTNADIR